MNKQELNDSINVLIDEENLDVEPIGIDEDNQSGTLFNIMIALNKKRDNQLQDVIQDIIYAIDSGVATGNLKNQFNRLGD